MHEQGLDESASEAGGLTSDLALAASPTGQLGSQNVTVWDDRGWTLGDFNRAGDALRLGPGPEYDAALERVQHWRASFKHPMFATRVTLENRVRRIDPTASVVQRLKRLSSITAKLTRFDRMKLTRMQDIGGCRAILATVADCRSLAAAYPPDQVVDDYIVKPKNDGYRGIHIVRPYSSYGERAPLNGRKVEIQIRTTFQHLWATAVEVVDSVRSDRLKAGAGDLRWARFFVLTSTLLAISEECPQVPGTGDVLDVFAELEELNRTINALVVLRGFATSLNVVEGRSRGAGSARRRGYILQLDTKRRRVSLIDFKDDLGPESEAAQRELFGMERSDLDPHIQTVLVYASSLENLKRSYRNYFLDTVEFAKAIEDSLMLYRERFGRRATYSIVAPEPDAADDSAKKD